MKKMTLTAALGVLLLMTSLSGHALNGSRLAEQLNNRYRHITAQCADQAPAYQCSGLLIRGFEQERSLPFWLHDATAMRLGAESFLFLHADIGTRKLPFSNGVVFIQPDITNTQQPELGLLCVYPFDVDPGIDWLGYGCSAPVHAQPDETEPVPVRQRLSMSQAGSNTSGASKMIERDSVRLMRRARTCSTSASRHTKGSTPNGRSYPTESW